MNRKTVLGVSLAAAFAVTMIFAQSASAGANDPLILLSEDSGSAAGILAVEITTGGNIVESVPGGAYGYGVFTDNNGLDNVLALTTHICASDHFSQSMVKDGSCGHTIGVLKFLNLGNDNQHNGAEMHAHILDLKDSTGGACDDVAGNSGVEVDIGSTLAGNNVIAMYTIEIDGNVIRTAAPISDLNGEDEVVNVASYGIAPIATKQGTITNLCLTNVSFLYPPS